LYSFRKQELEQIANLCEQLESHLIADEEGFELTKKLVDTIVDDSNAKIEIDDDETEEDDFLRIEEKSACLARHNAESLLQRMFMKMTKVGEDEMAGKVGDAISSLCEIKRTRRRNGDEKKKKKDARRRSASTSEEEEEDDDDDERTIELKAVACSQIGAEATQRNPEVQTFRMRKNKEVEVCVHESSWSDAGLAFRIWGAARVAFRVVDFASEYFIEKEKTCLELGSGCGLIGAAIASLDGGRCTVTEGAPGALAALRKTALGVNEASKKESMKVAFLDWRDDLAALEEEKNGTVECIDSIANAQSTKSPTPSFSSSSTCNFVHANKATFENAHVNMRLEDDARFDCLVGSDLMYDRQHCTALAASVVRRLRPNGEAIIFLAVRSEELLIAFSKKCAKRGLSVGVYAPTKPHEDLEDFSETTGGHANRPLPESCNEYWDLVAEKFSTCLLSKDYASFAPLVSSSSSSLKDDETSASIRSTLEGRFAMVRVVLAEKEEYKEQKQQQEVESEESDDESLKGVPVGDVKSMRVKL
jgi:predicted nicotinamide N-methyase